MSVRRGRKAGSIRSPWRGAVAGFALAALLAAPAPGRAEGEIESQRSGPYLGLSAGGALPTFDGEYFFTPPPFQSKVTEETSVEVMGRVGWRLLPYLALEGQYEWIRGWELVTKRTSCAKADAQILTGNVRLIAPFEAVHPYLVTGLGAGRYKSSVSEKPFDQFGNQCTKTNNVDFSEDDWEPTLRVGGGLDVYITRSILFNLEVSSVYVEAKPFGEAFPFVSISGGLGYRF